MNNKITPKNAYSMISSGEKLYIADIRQDYEYEQGHIINAVHLPLCLLRTNANKLMPDKKVPIILYCRSGSRSAQASIMLNLMGYEHIYDLGGIISWPYDLEC